MFKVGDKVKTRNPNLISHLNHRKNRNGVITNIDSSYILVKPFWSNWEYEAYPNELEKVL
jgi:hypothetical protein